MKTKTIFICLFSLLLAAKTYAQTDTESAVANTPDPSKKERADDPGIQWKKISTKDLIAVRHIEELLINAPGEKFEIVSCKVTFDGDNVPYFEYDIKGNEFSEAVIGNIQKSDEGTKIMIEFIKASMADGTIRLLNPVNLILSE